MSKVLLVEDDNNLREIYEARLQAEGYDIVSAKDGEEALVVAKAEKPDLIISDVMMPKISGFEMLDILRNTSGLKDMKVIMLTALGQAEDQTRANKLGADKYLVKSQVTLEDIVKVSHELLQDLPEEENNTSETELNTSAVSEPVQEQPQVTPTPNPEPVSQPSEPTPITANEAFSQPVQEQPQVTPTPNPEPVSQPSEPTPITANEAFSQPVQEQPQVTPTPNPEPVSQPETNIKTDEITVDDNGVIAQTEEQESIMMNQKINDFLNTTPGTTEVNNSSNNNTQVNPQPSTSSQASNDQTLAEAVNNLMMDEPNDAQTQDSTTVTTQQNPNNNALEENQSSAYDSNNNPAQINGKKVIRPINSTEPTKSLDELLAQEEAMEKIANNSDQNNTNNTPSKPFDPSDPNNIAI